MKISKWAYSIEEGPIEPVYVYEAPVRFWHWLSAPHSSCWSLRVSDWLAADCKLRHHLGDLLLRKHHPAALGFCGMLFAVLMLYRIYWAFVGNKSIPV